MSSYKAKRAIMNWSGLGDQLNLLSVSPQKVKLIFI